MKYLVPLSRDKRASCERIVTNLDKEAVAEREVQRLYTCWRTAEPALRERIEQHLRLFLRAAQATRDDDKSDTELCSFWTSTPSVVCAFARADD